jgi:hypothetical protein
MNLVLAIFVLSWFCQVDAEMDAQFFYKDLHIESVLPFLAILGVRVLQKKLLELGQRNSKLCAAYFVKPFKKLQTEQAKGYK